MKNAGILLVAALVLAVWHSCSQGERPSSDKAAREVPLVLPNFSCPEPREPPQQGIIRRPRRVFVVVLENADDTMVLPLPYHAWLAANGTYFSNYHGLRNPSLPNYLALTAGDTFHREFNRTNGGFGMQLEEGSIVDLLEAKGRSWKTYAEEFNGNCREEPDYGSFARRHVPFLYFRNVAENPARCAKIVNSDQLGQDVSKGKLPEFALYIPNDRNNGHDTGPEFADQWLKARFEPLLKDPAFIKDTLFVVVYDEDGNRPDHQIYAVFYGDMVKAGAKVSSCYTHYDLLRTFQEIFGLGSLNRNDAAGVMMTGAWR